MNQAGGGEQTGPVFDNCERGDDAPPDHCPHGGQRHGMPGHHDREAIQTSAGEIEEDIHFLKRVSTGGATLHNLFFCRGLFSRGVLPNSDDICRY